MSEPLRVVRGEVINLSDTEHGEVLIALESLFGDKELFMQFPSSVEERVIYLTHKPHESYVYADVPYDKSEAVKFFNVRFLGNPVTPVELTVIAIPINPGKTDMEAAIPFMGELNGLGAILPSPEEIDDFHRILADHDAAIDIGAVRGGPVPEETYGE